MGVTESREQSRGVTTSMKCPVKGPIATFRDTGHTGAGKSMGSLKKLGRESLQNIPAYSWADQRTAKSNISSEERTAEEEKVWTGSKGKGRRTRIRRKVELENIWFENTATKRAGASPERG